MTTRPVILLDNSGVMNDNETRSEQWMFLAGEFFASRLRGSASAWAVANYVTTKQIYEPARWLQRLQTSVDYASFENAYRLDWLRGMGQFLKIPLPAEDECIQLCLQVENEVIPRLRSALPGASEAIEQLHTEGYTLHTASSESSAHLGMCLESMGIRHCFGRLYGPDLLNTFKEGPDYYTQLFAHLHIAPGDALVVDDSPLAIAWARAIGARTALVGATGETDDGTLHIHSLTELPALLQQLA